MNSRIRVGLYATMIVLIALGSAFSVVPARADDGAPPPPAAPSTPSVANNSSAHSQVPSGADVAVVNGAGHKVSLASQQAADITASSDPIWCPTGVAPKPGLGGCTFTQGMFNSGGLLSFIVNKAVNGTIWIVSGPEADVSPVTLDGSLGTTTSHALTVNGGWNGAPTGTLNPLAPSIFNVPLTINWNAAVTLNDIKITGTAGTGLTVTTPGNIVLNNIDADSNSGRGASLNNSSGTGAVTVNSSIFINNHSGDGLFVKSNRAIVLKNITAVNNNNNGAYLDNCNGDPAPDTLCTTPTAQPVIISGVNNFNFNSAAGLWVYSRGAITVGNITAAYNGGDDGAYLDNCRYDGGSGLCRIPGAYAVTVKGTNFFSNNGYDGLEIWASGPITASNLTSNNNGTHLDSGTPANTAYFGMGANLNNFGALIGKPITLTGTNSFTGNAATGLWLDSFGAVKVSNLTANLNGLNSACYPIDICDGLHLPNWDASGFTLTGFGNFNGNGDDGIDATVWGSISLTNLTVDGNGGWGVNVDNCSFDVNVCDAHGNIVVTGTNVFTNNAFTGFIANSAGVVTLTNVTASYNGFVGADPADGDGVFIANCPFNTGSQICNVAIPRSVVLSGVNTFNGNYAAGLRVNSLGPITARQVTANGNGTDGARLDNQFGLKNYNITLTGFNVFNSNSGIGLEAYSNGNIILSNIAANKNTGGLAGAGVHAGGAYLDNKSTILSPTAVILTGINTFNDNGSSSLHFGSGLYTLSDGAITISNLTADNNQGYGAFLDNWSRSILARNITLTGVNTFMKNRLDGLNFTSRGSTSLTQVTSDFNGSDGIYGTAFSGKIILTCGSMYFNGGRGNDLFVFAPSTIALRGVLSGLNGAGDLFSVPPVVTYACPIP